MRMRGLLLPSLAAVTLVTLALQYTHLAAQYARGDTTLRTVTAAWASLVASLNIQPWATTAHRAAAGGFDCEHFGSQDGPFLCTALNGTPTWEAAALVCAATAEDALGGSVLVLPAPAWAAMRFAAYAALLPRGASSSFPVNFTTLPWDAVPQLGTPPPTLASAPEDPDPAAWMTAEGAIAAAAGQAPLLTAHGATLTRAYTFDARFDVLLAGAPFCELSEAVEDAAGGGRPPGEGDERSLAASGAGRRLAAVPPSPAAKAQPSGQRKRGGGAGGRPKRQIGRAHV